MHGWCHRSQIWNVSGCCFQLFVDQGFIVGRLVGGQVVRHQATQHLERSISQGLPVAHHRLSLELPASTLDGSNSIGELESTGSVADPLE